MDPKHLRKLFYQLGVTDSIQAPKQTVVLPTASKPTSPWGAVDLGEAPDGGWVIQDHSAEEFEAIVESVLAADDESQAVRSMQFLAEMLSSQWAAHLSHWVSATCVSRSGELLSSCACDANLHAYDGSHHSSEQVCSMQHSIMCIMW